MGVGQFYDAVRMKQIEDSTVVAGFVDLDGHLLLQRRDEITIDAGLVKGAKGDKGDQGDPGTDGLDGTDGVDALATLAVGMIIDWPLTAPVPPYALECNGSAVSRSINNVLFGVIGTQYGTGDGSTTFNVPNLSPKTRPMFQVKHNTTWAASGAAAQRLMNFNTVITNQGNYWDATNSRFVAPYTGMYEFIAKVAQATTAVGPTISLYKNGVLVDEIVIAYDDYESSAGNRILSLQAGDYIQLYWQNANSTTVTIDGTRSSFSGVYLGPLEGSDPLAPTKKIIIATEQGPVPTIINGLGAYPLGALVPWPGENSAPIPSHCLEMNGQTVSASVYSGLSGLFPSWVSGDNLQLPDMRGHAFAGYKSGDDVFGTLGAKVGTKTHKHTAGGLFAAIYAGYLKFRSSSVSWTATNSNNLTIPGANGSSNAGGPAVEGETSDASSIQPTYVGRWLIVAADAAGEYSPTIQTALVGNQSLLLAFKDRSWQDVRAAPVSSPAGKVSYDDASSCVNIEAGTILTRLDNVFELGYEYEIELILAVISGHATDNSAWFRMCNAGVANTLSNYQTAGQWFQYNATQGVYSVSAGTGGAIGVVSGASSYVDFNSKIRFTPFTLSAFTLPGYFYSFESFTSGSARGVRGGGYTPAPPSIPFDGILFYIHSAVSEVMQGKIKVRRRKLF